MNHDARYNAVHLTMMVRDIGGVPERHAHHLYALARRPRPPGRLRLSVASLLARAAARLAGEPVAVLPRRA